MNSIPLKAKITAAQLFKVSAFREVIKPTVPHRHAGYFELIVLFDGAGEHVIDDVSYEVMPPVVFFLQPGQTHCWNFSRIPKGYVLLFREELLNAADLSICYQLATFLPLSAAEPVKTLVEQLHCDFRGGNDEVELMSAYMHLLLTKLRLITSPTHPPVHAPLYYSFKKLLSQAEYPRQLKACALQLQATVQQLSRACRAAGTTSSQLLNERILVDAKVLLGGTSIAIKHIALDLGFTDTSHFVKFFKSGTNLTPGEYREQALRYRDMA